jgi:D-alanine-D-alanine ligase
MGLRVALFFGGRSAEHEISIISAQQVIAVLRERHQVVPVYIARDGRWYTGDALLQIASFSDIPALLRRLTEVTPSLDPARPLLYGVKRRLFGPAVVSGIDVAFPVMHGVHGEDGTLQGLFEMAGLPYVGSSTAASAMGMDKVIAKLMFRAAGLPVLDGVWFHAGEWLDRAAALVGEIEERLGWPVVVKPATLGSSIGVNRAGSAEELREAIDLALEFAPRVLVESAVEPLREINCAVVGDREQVESSVCEEPVSSDQILSFDDKYRAGGGKSAGMASLKRIVPAELPETLERELRQMACDTFRALDCSGAARVDFLIDRDGRPWVNEINTIPGSLSFYLWEASGKSFADLLDQQIEIALKRHREKGRLIFSQENNLLADYATGGSKGGSKGGAGGGSKGAV